MGWYSLAGVLYGPFLSPELALDNLNARVEQWRFGARRLGGSAWRPGPDRVVVALPEDTVLVDGDVLATLRASWTAPLPGRW